MCLLEIFIGQEFVGFVCALIYANEVHSFLVVMSNSQPVYFTPGNIVI